MAAALILIGSGTAAAILLGNGTPRGAATPEEAVAKFVDAVSAKRLTAAAGMVAPSDVDLFTGVAGAAVANGTAASASPEQTKALTDLWDCVSLDVTGLRFNSVPLAEGVQRIEFVAGAVTVDADPAQLASAFRRAAEASPALERQGIGPGAAEELDQTIDRIGAALPYSITADDAAQAAGFTPAVVAVAEGGKWYVSPSMTLAEIAFEFAHKEMGQLTRGDALNDGERVASDSAEAAATAFLAALEQTVAGSDLRALAGALPLAEARALAVYGSALGAYGAEGEQSGAGMALAEGLQEIVDNAEQYAGLIDPSKLLAKAAIKTDGGWNVSLLKLVAEIGALASLTD
jgi:hypothetical protein